MKKGARSLIIYISKEENQPGEEKVYREFNEDGKMVLQVEYKEDSDDTISETKWKYDTNGNEIEKVIDFGENRTLQYFSEFDDKNRLSFSKTINTEGKVEDQRVFTWNEDETELVVTLQDEDGNTIGEELKYYHPNKDIKEELYYDEEGNLAEKYTYQYDDQSRLIDKIEAMGGFESHYRYEYETDSENNITEMKVIDEEGGMHITRTEFHDNGKKSMEEFILLSGASEVFYYDEDEKVRQEEKYDTTGFKISESHYFYDDEGDLVRKHILADNKYFRIDYEYSMTLEDEEE
ncbi:MAG: hypothetical protein AAF502_13665 [Bacteroidota bacterium]